ncbi:unnamed protein product, partial [Prorocentrum cordatum]
GRDRVGELPDRRRGKRLPARLPESKTSSTTCGRTSPCWPTAGRSPGSGRYARSTACPTC